MLVLLAEVVLQILNHVDVQKALHSSEINTDEGDSKRTSVALCQLG